MQVQLQALGRRFRAMHLHRRYGKTCGVEWPVDHDEAASHRRLRVQCGVQDLEQLVGGAEGGGELVAARRRTGRGTGCGGQDVGDAGEPVPDLMGKGRQNLRLGQRQPFGFGQGPRPIGNEGLTLGRQRELAAQDPVQDQAQGHRQGQRSAGGDGGGAIGPRQEEGEQGRGGGGRTDHQQAVQARRGEEHAGHGGGDVDRQDDVTHRPRIGAEHGDLGHRQSPEQAAADMESHPTVDGKGGLVLA